MRNIRTEFEIDKTEYDKLITVRENNKKQFHDMIEEIAYRSMFKPNAYGFYLPITAFESCGKYYVSWTHYDSCD